MYVKEYQLKYNKTNTKARKLEDSRQTFEFLYMNVYDRDEINIFESFYIVLLNAANKVKGFARISQGGINGTPADMRLIAKYAVESLATAIIITHNHPSGNTTPSRADENLTHNIDKAMKLFDIKLIDHIIVADNSYFSFADSGLL